MVSTGPANVGTAFEMLFEEIKAHIAAADQTGAAAFQRGDYDAVTRMAAKAKSMKEFMDRVDSMRQEWAALVGPTASIQKTPSKPTSPGRRTSPDRLRPGLRTSLEDFYRPILTATVELGGKARAAEVVERVGAMLRNTLTEADLKPLPSNPAVTRWHNGAHWARLKMVEQGLLRRDAPYGIWEITDAGRQYLAKNGQ